MMESRRCANAVCGTRPFDGHIDWPSSSGPRCRIARLIRARRTSISVTRLPTMPAMPHMFLRILFGLRRLDAAFGLFGLRRLDAAFGLFGLRRLDAAFGLF